MGKRRVFSKWILLALILPLLYLIIVIPFLQSAEGLSSAEKASIGEANLIRTVFIYGFLAIITSLASFWKKFLRLAAISVLLCWILGSSVVAAGIFSEEQYSPPPIMSNEISTLIPKIEPEKTPIPITSVIDSDPIVVCKSDLCDGGEIRQSECKNSTCCQFGYTWVFYKNKDKCKQDQLAYYDSLINKRLKLPSEIEENQQNVECIVGGKTYTYSSWANCLKAQQIYNHYLGGISEPEDFVVEMKKQINQSAEELLEKMNFEVSIPTSLPYDFSEFERQTRASFDSFFEPSLKPKCPPTYFYGDVTFWWELPCEP